MWSPFEVWKMFYFVWFMVAKSFPERKMFFLHPNVPPHNSRIQSHYIYACLHCIELNVHCAIHIYTIPRLFQPNKALNAGISLSLYFCMNSSVITLWYDQYQRKQQYFMNYLYKLWTWWQLGNLIWVGCAVGWIYFPLALSQCLEYMVASVEWTVPRRLLQFMFLLT